MFIYNQWEEFCKQLQRNGVKSITASEALRNKSNKKFLILKHDVENRPKKALKLAKIESKYGHSGSYYVQAYLLNKNKNINIFKEIQMLGHELSYHHDVMDSNKGNIEKAKQEFDNNIYLFRKNGFKIKTVCQHGNPIVKRIGYYSNRDFFRDKMIASYYKDIVELMVNFKSTVRSDYKYISDSGYKWKIVFDPENNDIVNSDDKNILLNNLDEVLEQVINNESIIISTHPHRWEKNILVAKIKNIGFATIKKAARAMLKISITKKLMEKFYYLAKRI